MPWVEKQATAHPVPSALPPQERIGSSVKVEVSRAG